MRVEQSRDRRSVGGQADDRHAAFCKITDTAPFRLVRSCTHQDASKPLQHRSDHSIGRAVAVGEGDIDDHPLAHRGWPSIVADPHMGQLHDIVEGAGCVRRFSAGRDKT